MTWETANLLRNVGVALLLAAALVLLLINIVLARALPRLVLPFMLLVWIAGLIGFVLVLIVDHSPLNVALAILFVVAIGFHGWRMVRRSRPSIEDESEAGSEDS